MATQVIPVAPGEESMALDIQVSTQFVYLEKLYEIARNSPDLPARKSIMAGLLSGRMALKAWGDHLNQQSNRTASRPETGSVY